MTETNEAYHADTSHVWGVTVYQDGILIAFPVRATDEDAARQKISDRMEMIDDMWVEHLGRDKTPEFFEKHFEWVKELAAKDGRICVGGYLT